MFDRFITSTNHSDHFINLQQGKIFARVWKPKINTKMEPMLLMHDSLGCVDLWRDFPALLCQKSGRKIIAYDRLGYGRSDIRLESLPMSFMQEESKVFLPAVLNKFQVKKFIVFGHSAGGQMATICASQFNDACVGAIIESAPSFVEDQTLQGVISAKKKFQTKEQIERLKKYHGEKAEWVLKAWTDIWLDPSFSSWSLKADLPRVKCPLLVIHGDQDELGSIKHPKMICDLTGGSSQMHILQNCGHFPHREKTELILDLVVDFLEHNISNHFELNSLNIPPKL